MKIKLIITIIVIIKVSMFVPVIMTLLSSVAPFRLSRGEGRAAEMVQKVAEGRRSSVLSRYWVLELEPPVTSKTCTICYNDYYYY